MKLVVLLILFLVCFKFLSFSKTSNCYKLNHASYFNGTENIIFKNSHILISDGIIQQISQDEISAKDNLNCESLNVENSFIVPGLIDSHTHLLAYDKQFFRSWKSALEFVASQPSYARLNQGILNSDSMLLHGFTTVRDLGNSGHFLDFKLKEILASSDSTKIEIIPSGPGIDIFPSQIDLKLNSKEYLLIKTEDDLDAILKDIINHKGEWVKVYADNSRENYASLSAEFLKRIVAKIHNNNLKIALHAEKYESIINSFESGADSIEHFYNFDSFDMTLASKSVVVLTNRCINEFCNDFSNLIKKVSWLKKNKINFVFGSDAVLDFTNKYTSRGESALASLLLWKHLPLDNYEILKAATSDSAKLLNIKSGEIVPEYKADLIVYKNNPLVNLDALKKPVAIFKNGLLVCGFSSKACPNE